MLKEPLRDSGTEIELILGFLRAEKFQVEQEIEPYLGDNKKTQPKQQNTGAREPSTNVCIDEARGLLKSPQLGNNLIIFSKSPSEVLGTLLLDTTSRVSNFSPSADKDIISLVLGSPFGPNKILFPPIYAIDSLDIYVESNLEHSIAVPPSNPLEIDAECLFSHGRPLWGSHLKTQSLQAVMDLAKAKVRGDSKRAALALLSYRLDFYVEYYTLVEELIS